MSEANNWNEKIIAEFRANGGQVGGPFAGAPMVLVHSRGRKSGQEYVNPMMYLASERGDGAIYVFASKGGAPARMLMGRQERGPTPRAASEPQCIGRAPEAER